MSKYKENRTSERENNLRELILSVRRTQDELNPLQVYLNTLKGQISEIMDELDITEFEGVKKIVEQDKLVDLEKLSSYGEIFKYAVGNVDEKTTLSLMYKDHIDYTVAKRLLEKAITESSIQITYDEQIKV